MPGKAQRPGRDHDVVVVRERSPSRCSPRLASSSRHTSSSVVCEKSSYQGPMAKNGLGVSSTTTSSASRRHLLDDRLGRRDRVPRAPLGAHRGPARSAGLHRAVLPVAMPSSTIRTVRPSSATIGRVTTVARARRSTSTRSRASTSPISRGFDLVACDHVVVQHARAALADRTHRQLGLERHPELAHDHHVERCACSARARSRPPRALRPAGSASTTGLSSRRDSSFAASAPRPRSGSGTVPSAHLLAAHRRTSDHPRRVE